MSFTDYTENNVLDALGNIQTFVAPISIYVALSSVLINDTGSITEPSTAIGYARVAAPNWSVTGSTASNNSIITFPQATGSWGTITRFALFDDIIGNSPNMIAFGFLTASKLININNIAEFPIGSITVTLD